MSVTEPHTIRRLHQLAGLSLVLGAMTLTPPSLLAQMGKPTAIAVFDLRAPDGSVTVSAGQPYAAIYSFAEASTAKVDCSKPDEGGLAIGRLMGLIQCATDRSFGVDPAPTTFDLEKGAAAAALVGDILRSSGAERSPRVISRKGSRMLLVVIQTAIMRSASLGETRLPLLVEGRRPSFTVTEEDRDSQIVRDLAVLAKLVVALGSRPASLKTMTEKVPREELRQLGEKLKYESKAVPWLTVDEHALVLKRATLTVDASLPDAAAERLAQGVPDDILKEWLAAIRRATDAEQAAELKRRAAQLTECPPKGTREFSQLHLLACLIASGNPPGDRVAAAKALGKLAHPDAVLALRPALTDQDPAVRNAASGALALLKPIALPSPWDPDPEIGPAPARKLTALSGPGEHLFLSADVLVASSKAFKNDDSGITLAEPSDFYVGVNYSFGDLATEKRKGWRNVYLKFFVKGSTTPFDSIGFGAGVRGFKVLGISLEALSPFVGFTFTERPEDDRGVQVNLGIAVPLDTALKWLAK